MSFWLSDVMGQSQVWNQAQTLGLCQQLREHMGASLPPTRPLVHMPCRASQASKQLPSGPTSKSHCLGDQNGQTTSFVKAVE